MKETGLDHWNSPNTGATNESGFTALPAGYRDGPNGSFTDKGNTAFFWTSSLNENSAWYRKIYHNDSG